MDRELVSPNLFIVGAAKSGTTSIHNYLNQHPEIYMCTPKEPHFLINKEIGVNRIPSGVINSEEYYDLFYKGKSLNYRGESSVMYLMYPEIVIPKIKYHFGDDVKIIIALRNPIDRAYSGYHHVRRYNIKETNDSFLSAWNVCEERYLQDNLMTPASRYRTLGMYYEQVKKYKEEFENVKIVFFEDFKNNSQNEMDSIFCFLGISSILVDQEKKYMVGGWNWKNNYVKNLLVSKNNVKQFFKFVIPFKKLRKLIRNRLVDSFSLKISEMTELERKVLRDYYEKDILKLSKFLKKDLQHWLS